jgi:hypothetical protein
MPDKIQRRCVKCKEVEDYYNPLNTDGLCPDCHFEIFGSDEDEDD